jgi:hypothetical protein
MKAQPVNVLFVQSCYDSVPPGTSYTCSQQVGRLIGHNHRRNKRKQLADDSYLCPLDSGSRNSTDLAVQYSTVQYSTVQYSTVQYSTVQYSTVQYSTVQYSTVQYSTVRYVAASRLEQVMFPVLCFL